MLSFLQIAKLSQSGTPRADSVLCKRRNVPIGGEVRSGDTSSNYGLQAVGVAFHMGSGCREPQVFLRAIAEAKKVGI